MLHLAGHQFQYVVMLLDLDQVTVIELAQQQILCVLENFFHALRDELRAVVAEATHPQLRSF
ncbi:hypothetical protein D3C78_1957400 [compost metagenome]